MSWMRARKNIPTTAPRPRSLPGEAEAYFAGGPLPEDYQEDLLIPPSEPAAPQQPGGPPFRIWPHIQAEILARPLTGHEYDDLLDLIARPGATTGEGTLAKGGAEIHVYGRIPKDMADLIADPALAGATWSFHRRDPDVPHGLHAWLRRLVRR